MQKYTIYVINVLTKNNILILSLIFLKYVCRILKAMNFIKLHVTKIYLNINTLIYYLFYKNDYFNVSLSIQN